MIKLIRDIHNAVQNSRKTIEFLEKNSSWTWIGNYPIAIVNEINRIQNPDSLNKLNEINFFNTSGFSKHTYTQDEIDYIVQNIPDTMKTAYCICLKKPQTDDYTFKEKFEHDRWKKVTDDGNFESLVEFSKFNEEASSKEIETSLRDIMRAAKEIPSLKKISFVWIVTVPKTTNINNILTHYFKDNHIYVEQGRKTSYIAWGEKLSKINMRYFVNTP